ncbi:MAG: hypothetical protein Q3966_03805 [Neisseria sp.]|nr:hypothetical protein [Neisseria sp.]
MTLIRYILIFTALTLAGAAAILLLSQRYGLPVAHFSGLLMGLMAVAHWKRLEILGKPAWLAAVWIAPLTICFMLSFINKLWLLPAGVLHIGMFAALCLLPEKQATFDGLHYILIQESKGGNAMLRPVEKKPPPPEHPEDGQD